jgi:serralysin
MPGVNVLTPTGNPHIDGLLLGYEWATNSLTFSFPQSASYYGAPASYSSDQEPANNFAAFNAPQANATRAVLAMYAEVANLSFSELNETALVHADLRYARSGDPSTAWAYGPSASAAGGDVWLSTFSSSYTSPARGNYAWHTLLHETGHALGLKHPHEAEGSFGVMPSSDDAMENTVMSYRAYAGAPLTGYANETWGFAQTPMEYDIAALQEMYGANFTTRSGNTVYRWDPTTGQEFIDGVGQGAPGGNRIFMTVWDGGGNDTYDFSSYATNLQVDLRPGQSSLLSSAQRPNLGSGRVPAGNVYNAGLYHGDTRSMIENAYGGSGNDSILGNDTANTLIGNAGDDFLNGFAGSDALYGGVGNDTLVTISAQVMDGGGGTDTVQMSSTGTFDLTAAAMAGIEQLVGSDGSDFLYVSTARLAGVTHIDMRGGTDFVRTRDGSLDLSGVAFVNFEGIQSENAAGTAFTADSVVIAMSIYGGGAADSVTVANLVLSDAEKVAITSHGIETIYDASGAYRTVRDPSMTRVGTSGDDYLTGGTGDDVLIGHAGRDTLVAVGGADYLAGGDGDDTVIGGDGSDSLNGEAGDDYIYGGGIGTDALFGGDGVDSLNGGVGNDYIVGGAGNDGLFGATGADNLNGGDGDDYLAAGDGNNYLFGDAGTDSLNGGLNNDFMAGGDGNDGVFGGLGNDTLAGGGGVDWLVSGTGDDRIVFRRGDGSDTVADFDVLHDVIDLAGWGLTFAAVQARMSQSGNNTRIDLGGGDTLTLVDVPPTALQANDFLL